VWLGALTLDGARDPDETLLLGARDPDETLLLGARDPDETLLLGVRKPEEGEAGKEGEENDGRGVGLRVDVGTERSTERPLNVGAERCEGEPVCTVASRGVRRTGPFVRTSRLTGGRPAEPSPGEPAETGPLLGPARRPLRRGGSELMGNEPARKPCPAATACRTAAVELRLANALDRMSGETCALGAAELGTPASFSEGAAIRKWEPPPPAPPALPAAPLIVGCAAL
jgi:hypothetical protein